MDISNIGGSTAFGIQATFDQNATTEIIKNTTVTVVGSGAVGMLTMHLLQGNRFISRCDDPSHAHIKTEHKNKSIYDREAWGQEVTGARGKTSAGQNLDVFRYTTTLPAESLDCLSLVKDGPEVDCVMISNNPPGGSWHKYDEDQKTISPWSWMFLPGFPEGDQQDFNLFLPDSGREDRMKTDAGSLRHYFQKCSQQLPTDKIFDNHQVTRAEIIPQGWKLTVQGLKGNMTVETKFLVLAVGMTKPREVGFEGENSVRVSHSTAEAVEKMSKLDEQSEVLVVGTGLSAADTINRAWDAGMRVTHLVPEELLQQRGRYKSRGSTAILMSLSGRNSEYPQHCQVIDAMTNASGQSDSYTRLTDYRLKKLSGDGTASLMHDINPTLIEQFDHVAVLCGSMPDFSFLRNEQDEELLQTGKPIVDPGTMRIDGISNLYIAGSCSGDPFQRFVLGHAVAVVEDIKEQLSSKLDEELVVDAVMDLKMELI